MPYCQECGAEVSEYEQFCGECGADLSAEDSSHDQQDAWSDDSYDQQGGQQGGGYQEGGGRQRGRRQQGQAQGGQATRARGGLPQERTGAFSFAFSYPKSIGWTPTIISSVLYFLGQFLFFPILFVYGYGFQIARSAALGREYPPEYEDWGGAFIDGLRLFAIGFVVAILWFIGLLVLVVTGAAVSDGVGILLGFLGLLAFPWLLNAYLTAFVGSNSVTAALTNGQAIELLKTGFYLKALLVYIGLAIVLGIITVVSIITIVGPFVVGAYSLMAFGAYWGHVYYRAVQKGILDPPVQDQQRQAQAPQTGGARGQPR